MWCGLQADVQHLLYVLAACAVGLINSLSLGMTDVLRWLAPGCALAAACMVAHYFPSW
jgi:predicted outer membrane lipoprotein